VATKRGRWRQAGQISLDEKRRVREVHKLVGVDELCVQVHDPVAPRSRDLPGRERPHHAHRLTGGGWNNRE